ncbi:MAG: ABC transporter ATP-binding protein/permease [Planctomycetes bacterium]|nr:ABC transporter ATP-binding protein/permease [Planctomycetota bacterium]
MFRIEGYRFLAPWFRPEWRAYGFGALLVAATSVFMVAIPKLVGEAVSSLESRAPIERVTWLAAAVVVAVLLRAATAYWMRMVIIGASRRIEFRLRNHLFRHLETLDASFFVRTHTGDIMNRFTSDMEAVRAALGPGIMYTLNTLATFLLALAVMLEVDVRLTLYSLVPLLLLAVVLRYFGPRVHRESMRAQELLSDLSVHAQENFSNVKVVKAFVREGAEIERMRRHSEQYFAQNMRLARLRSWTNAILWLIGDLVVLSLLAIGGYQLIHGEISLGDFAAFKGCQLLLIWPMVALGWVITIFQRGAASAERVEELLAARPLVGDDRARAETRVTAGRLQFRDVGIAYEPRGAILQGIDIDLPAGKTLGVVGPTGCGKSSLLALIPRLLPATGGEIAIDGAPIETIPLAALRDAVGFVPQEPFLFSATVEENIAFGVSDATPDAVRAIARVVAMDREIAEFPDGYQQRVGERGITLSGGQKQRLALARALFKRPRILVLDDVLSAVDAGTETEILRGLRDWTSGLTTVIATHRLSAVRHAHEIVVLDGGAVVQRGTHDELVARPGYYADLYRKQTIEDELEQLE